MKKIYFLIPIIGCLLFAGLYWNFLSHNAEKERARDLAIQQEKEAKLAREVEERRKAYEDAIALAERRKQEKEAREERDRREREERQTLLDERERVFREQERIANQIRRLKDEVKVEQDAVSTLKEQIAEQQAEIRDQDVHVKLAQENEKKFQDILGTIEAVDKAAAEAAAAAALAAKNKS